MNSPSKKQQLTRRILATYATSQPNISQFLCHKHLGGTSHMYLRYFDWRLATPKLWNVLSGQQLAYMRAGAIYCEITSIRVRFSECNGSNNRNNGSNSISRICNNVHQESWCGRAASAAEGEGGRQRIPEKKKLRRKVWLTIAVAVTAAGILFCFFCEIEEV